MTGLSAAALRAFEELRPGAEIKHLWRGLIIIALIGVVGLLLMVAV
jgi:hypothetical protein